MIGKTISHYKIIEKLGSGGMGVVYKAEDIKLKRIVALKFLPPYLNMDEQAEKRFISEAQAASSLDHANICTIHEIGKTDDDQLYIVMACYEGETLKKKIERGLLKIDEAIDIAVQIAEGLEKAHEKGMVHRDIKPANIFITSDGTVKILDFGLAKVSTQTQMTTMGTTVGTIAYMSPEQSRGQNVDHRTDIWSLGVVLYEMITGQLPFRGEYEQAIVYSILNEEPNEVSSLNEQIPQNLERVNSKLLSKSPDSRYQTVRELLNDLKEPQTVVSESQKKEKSIIVLPFDDMSPAKDNEFFSDGLTEEIITALSRISLLRVISRNTTMMFKETRKSTKTIAQELNVQYVLEGSVRKSGDDLRITAQLIDAKNDTHLWAEKYHGRMDDVFEIQEKVSAEIVKKLQLELSPEEKEKMRAHPVQDMRAMECWLRAKQEIHHYTEDSFERAISMLNDGLKVVGENVLLYWGLGYINWFYVNMGIRLDTKCLDKADEYVNNIFELDPNSYYGFQLMGLIHYKRGDVKKSIEYTKMALEIEPNNPEALDHLIWMYADVGRTEKSTELIDRLLSVDPLTAHNHWAKGFTLMVDGKLEKGLDAFKTCHELEPKNSLWSWFYAHVLFMSKKGSDATTIAHKMENEAPEDIITILILLTKYAVAGEKEKVHQMINNDLKVFGEWDEIIAWILAQIYALIDEKEEAIDWLEKAVDRGFINYTFLKQYDPFLENLRGYERFNKLMEKVKYKWEHFEV